MYSGPPIEVDGIWDQKDYIYQVRKGDINGDGKLDLFVNRTSGGNANNGVLNATILQQQADKTFLAIAATPAQLSTAASWATATIEVVLSDFNMDGYVDLILKGISSHIAGANNQMVFSKGQLFSGQASSVRDIDDDFVKTFSSITHWLGDSNYFDNNIITVTGYTYVLTYGCQYDWFYGEYICGFYYVLVPYTATGYDASLISQDALDLRDALEDVTQAGEFVLDALSNPAKAVADILESILGETILGGVLRNGGILQIEIDAGLTIGSPHLDDTRGLVVRGQLAEVGEETGSFNSRPLTPGEIAMAVNNGLAVANINSVEVLRRGFAGLKVAVNDGNIYIPDNNTINFPWSEDYSVLSVQVSTVEQAIFVHELVHIYQQRTWAWDDARVGLESAQAGSDYCYGPFDPGKSYSDYNQEEQAEMVSDRFLLNKGFSQRLVCNRSVSLQQLDGVIDL
ncbi:VCBS repeat-containing protein [Porticoccaceae bacterium]|nr:VCBS repeat-containing protein [Porticoccaceae bacterium]